MTKSSAIWCIPIFRLVNNSCVKNFSIGTSISNACASARKSCAFVLSCIKVCLNFRFTLKKFKSNLNYEKKPILDTKEQSFLFSVNTYIIAIRIKEKDLINNVFTLLISFRDANDSEEEKEVLLNNPYDTKTDALLEWYFERYISTPYDDVKVRDAVQAIADYGQQLFQQIFTADILFRYRTAIQNGGPENIAIEIIGDSPAFQTIYWESLRDPKQTHPLAAQGAVFLRKNVKSLNVRATVKQSPTINLLIVTARPNEENDVDYRTIQRPLIDLIEETETPIDPYILRPGTYEALVRHLDQKAGHYHIIHFDLHGSLLDYATYLQVQEAVVNGPFQNTLYRGGYGLKELEEADFEAGKKAFIFFESKEKGKPLR